VEAQWILSVLGDCSDKLFLASFLTPAILDDPILNSSQDRNPIIVHFEYAHIRCYAVCCGGLNLSDSAAICAFDAVLLQ
jgi:hypothetical protein